ncbi:MAG: 3-hydroxyacyl-CoA dehydrogenase, partial [Hyphomicrobiaceae bacterium]|nr:3-hydroxyacyl-CoA dehydrogenase [Hyphomicrobiaceae bacterium]
HLLAEGVEPALIENAARLAGMPVGPLNLVDETKIDLAYHIIDQSRTDMGDAYKLSKAEDVIVRMYDLGRWGKLSGKGFYDYPEGGGKHLWPGLAEEYPPAENQPDVEEVKMRLLYSMAVDTARLLEENVLTDPADADIGAIYGFGYPRHTGGPISLIDMVGCESFVADCRRLADAHGERFAPPEMLARMAAENRSFYGSQPGQGKG